MNNLQIGDAILSPIQGENPFINMATTPVPNFVITAAQNFAPDGSVTPQTGTRQPETVTAPDGTVYTSFPSGINDQIASTLSPLSSSFSQWFGIDAQTAGKYVLLAVVGLFLIGIGLFALVAPEVRYVEKAAVKSAEAAG